METRPARFTLPPRKQPLSPFRWWRLGVLCIALLLWWMNLQHLDLFTNNIPPNDNAILLRLLTHAGTSSSVPQPLKPLVLYCLEEESVQSSPKEGLYLQRPQEDASPLLLYIQLSDDLCWQLICPVTLENNMDTSGQRSPGRWLVTLNLEEESSDIEKAEGRKPPQMRTLMTKPIKIQRYIEGSWRQVNFLLLDEKKG